MAEYLQLVDVDVLRVAPVSAGHHVAVVRPGQVGDVRCPSLHPSGHLVPGVVVPSQGDMLRGVEFPPVSVPIPVIHVHTLVQKFVQLIGNRRSPRAVYRG